MPNPLPGNRPAGLSRPADAYHPWHRQGSGRRIVQRPFRGLGQPDGPLSSRPAVSPNPGYAAGA